MHETSSLKLLKQTCEEVHVLVKLQGDHFTKIEPLHRYLSII